MDTLQNTLTVRLNPDGLRTKAVAEVRRKIGATSSGYLELMLIDEPTPPISPLRWWSVRITSLARGGKPTSARPTKKNKPNLEGASIEKGKCPVAYSTKSSSSYESSSSDESSYTGDDSNGDEFEEDSHTQKGRVSSIAQEILAFTSDDHTIKMF